jgi:hypothetical protein
MSAGGIAAFAILPLAYGVSWLLAGMVKDDPPRSEAWWGDVPFLHREMRTGKREGLGEEHDASLSVTRDVRTHRDSVNNR